LLALGLPPLHRGAPEARQPSELGMGNGFT